MSISVCVETIEQTNDLRENSLCGDIVKAIGLATGLMTCGVVYAVSLENHRELHVADNYGSTFNLSLLQPVHLVVHKQSSM